MNANVLDALEQSRLVVLETDFGRDQADRGRHFFRLRQSLGRARHFRRVEFTECCAAGAHADTDADAADFLFERDDGIAVAIDERSTKLREQDGGADRRMTCERKLAARRENANTRRVPRTAGVKTKTVSERLNSRAIVCMSLLLSLSASSTTASGLPPNARSVKTSRT